MKQFLIVLAVSFLGAFSARAQSAIVCTGTNTTISSATLTLVINACNVTTGTNGIIFASASAETTCAVDQQVQLVVGAGTSPVGGVAIPLPRGVTAITLKFNHTDCSGGKTAFSTVAGGFSGIASTAYWIGVAISSHAGGAVTWNNNQINVLAY